MNHATSRIIRITAVAMAVVLVSVAGAAPAAAGCLKEYGECGDCAEKALIGAIWDLDLGGMLDAYVDAMDCDIDLAHCLVYDSHHNYECGI